MVHGRIERPNVSDQRLEAAVEALRREVDDLRRELRRDRDAWRYAADRRSATWFLAACVFGGIAFLALILRRKNRAVR
jgi:hypothetical protein